MTVRQQAPQTMLKILDSPSRKRFTHPSYIPPFCNYLIQFDSSEMFLEIQLFPFACSLFSFCLPYLLPLFQDFLPERFCSKSSLC